ncbi:zinc ribbon domain-containing protein [Marinovum sp.]|uniref:Zn-ribbon domain-containing OB-fold protein n=1 Tax=Marinovum sp. TaxID=2024839 RepID=UPI002B269AC8|nr:zinc ribbon domain-containing protein [Marinovum sp.]
MKRPLQLDYNIPRGRLAPHFEALAQGRALALRCSCGHVAFPPALTCAACGAHDGDWVALSGQARIEHRTDTPGAAWALARFAGADTAVMLRIATPELTTRRGHLVPPEHHAGLWLALEETDDDD